MSVYKPQPNKPVNNNGVTVDTALRSRDDYDKGATKCVPPDKTVKAHPGPVKN
jgi:hypothetical protein